MSTLMLAFLNKAARYERPCTRELWCGLHTLQMVQSWKAGHPRSPSQRSTPVISKCSGLTYCKRWLWESFSSITATEQYVRKPPSFLHKHQTWRKLAKVSLFCSFCFCVGESIKRHSIAVLIDCFYHFNTWIGKKVSYVKSLIIYVLWFQKLKL